jgi:DNA repair exonuclease SbcCD ATPase subunit
MPDSEQTEYEKSYQEFDEAFRDGTPLHGLPLPTDEPVGASEPEPESSSPVAPEEVQPDLAAQVAKLSRELEVAESRRSHTEASFTRRSQELSELRGSQAALEASLTEAREARAKAEATAEALRGVLKAEQLGEEGTKAEVAATATVELETSRKREQEERAQLAARAENAERLAQNVTFESTLDRSSPFWRKVVPPGGRITTDAHKAFVQYRALHQDLTQRAASLDVAAASELFAGFAAAHPEYANAGGQAAAVPTSPSGRPASPARSVSGVMRPRNTGMPPADKLGAEDILSMSSEDFHKLSDGARSKAGIT